MKLQNCCSLFSVFHFFSSVFGYEKKMTRNEIKLLQRCYYYYYCLSNVTCHVIISFIASFRQDLRKVTVLKVRKKFPFYPSLSLQTCPNNKVDLPSNKFLNSLRF